MNARTKLGLMLALVGTGSVAVIAGCPASVPDACVDDPSCVAANADGGGGDGSQGDGGPTCDPSKDPSCVNDSSGVFVSSSGSDSNAGTKEAPLKTIGAALTKASGSKNAVYICAGTYPEHVKVTTGLSLYGGFACADWTYSAANKPKISPSDTGYALDIESVSSAVAIADLEFDSDAGTTAAPSSIAAFVNSSPQVTMSRVTLTAGAGATGEDGASSAATTLARGLKGNNADGGAGGAEQTCPCPDGNTVGGKGGSNVVAQLNGGAGQPDLHGTPPKDGEGGMGNLAACTSVGSGGIGGSGADGDAGTFGPSAEAVGTLDATGFHPSTGSAGTSGGRGQGGGGGGVTASGETSNAGAGGGGCGGCGGALGGGGAGGGASIALVAFDSPVTIIACTLSGDKAGDGGKGGDGQLGALGGTPGGDPSFLSCNGGTGGNGGNGGAGGGGAGGISAAIVQKGGAPQADSATQMSFKTAGSGGPPGAGGTGNGIAGVAQNVVAIP